MELAHKGTLNQGNETEQPEHDAQRARDYQNKTGRLTTPLY